MDDRWITNGVIYEIFVRTFSAAGNFKGVEKQLPELAELGVTTLWFMPIHPIGMQNRKGTLGSPYSVRDYWQVNPDYGSDRDFRKLLNRAHQLGLKVIIDWVANHCSWDNPLIGAHPQWVRRDKQGAILSAGHGWTDTAWLNHENRGLARYLLRAMLHWVTEFDVDGFRCDVANLVDLGFWEQARNVLERDRPDIGFLAEAYSPPLMEIAFDLAYDIPWYKAVRKAVTDRPITMIWEAHLQFKSKFPERAVPMRYIENHDKERFIALYGLHATQAAAVLLFTSEGTPLLLNGQEIGDAQPVRAPALFEPGAIRWNAGDAALRDFYKQLISMRRSSSALTFGATDILDSGSNHVIAYTRHCANDHCLVVINLSTTYQLVRLADYQHATPWNVLISSRAHVVLEANDTRLTLELEPWGFWVGRFQA